MRYRLIGTLAALGVIATLCAVVALSPRAAHPSPTQTASPASDRQPTTFQSVGSRLEESGSGRAAPHPRTGGISYSLARLRWIQRAVDRGVPRYRYYRDPVKVTRRDLPRFGYTGSPIVVVAPSPPEPAPTAHQGEDGLPETDVVVRYRGRRYWIVLNQFVKHGPGGIWSIITITPM